MSLSDDVKLEEYRTLRSELDANRRFVFERPLIIAGATLAAVAALPKEDAIVWLTLPFVVVLVFNLWFTRNRLSSSARVIGYMRVVYDGVPEREWIGWESSLREYRSWCFTNQQKLKKIDQQVKNLKQYDPMGYYSGIYWFHVLLAISVLLVILVFGYGTTSGSVVWPNLRHIWLIALGIVVLVGTIGSLYFNRPRSDGRRIEECEEIWKQVLRPVDGHYNSDKSAG